MGKQRVTSRKIKRFSQVIFPKNILPHLTNISILSFFFQTRTQHLLKFCSFLQLVVYISQGSFRHSLFLLINQCRFSSVGHSSMNSEKDRVWIVISLKRAKMTQRYTHSGFLPVAECQMPRPCAANYSPLRPQQQNSSTAIRSHQQEHSQFSFL